MQSPVIHGAAILLLSASLLIGSHGTTQSTLAVQAGSQTITFSTHHLNRAQLRTVSQFIRELNTTLAPADVQAARDVNDPANAAHLRFTPRFFAPWLEAINAGIRLDIVLTNPPLRSVSPVLYAHPRLNESDAAVFIEGDSALDMTVGILLYSVGRCDMAEAYLWPLLLRDASTVYTAGFHQSACALIQQDYPIALTTLNTILSIQDTPPRPEPAVNLAWLYLTLGHQQRAFNVLEQADESLSAHSPSANRIDFLTRRAQLFALGFEYDAAIADVDAAIALAPDDPALHVLRGQMVILLYEWDRVLENYNHALEIDPLFADAVYFRGVLYYSVLARDEALADFERYIQLAPQGAHAIEAARYIDSIRAELDALGN